MGNVTFGRLEIVEGVQESQLARGGIAADLGRTIDDIRAELPSHSCNLIVIRGNKHAIDRRCTPCGFDRPCQERLTRDGQDILAGDPLRPTASGDDSNDVRGHLETPHESWPGNRHVQIATWSARLTFQSFDVERAIRLPRLGRKRTFPIEIGALTGRKARSNDSVRGKTSPLEVT